MIFTADSNIYNIQGRKYYRTTRVLKAAGLYPPWSPTVQAAMDLGSYVHEVIRLDILGVLDEGSVSEDARGHLASFRSWFALVDCNPVLVEQVVFSRLLLVAGRLDFLAWIKLAGRKDPVLALLDLKTGVPRPADELQTAAYQAELEHGLDDLIKESEEEEERIRLVQVRDFRARTGRVCDIRGSVYTDSTGKTAAFKIHKDPGDIRIYTCLLEVMNWKIKKNISLEQEGSW